MKNVSFLGEGVMKRNKKVLYKEDFFIKNIGSAVI